MHPYLVRERWQLVRAVTTEMVPPRNLLATSRQPHAKLVAMRSRHCQQRKANRNRKPPVTDFTE